MKRDAKTRGGCMKKHILALLAVAGLVTLACGSGSNQAAQGSTIVLGAPLGLTGSLTKESALTKQGYDLWLDWINKQGGINVNGTKHPVTINDYATGLGMQVVVYKKYKNGATALTAEVQAAKAVNPDIVLNSGHLAEAIAIHKAAKEQKLNAKIFAYSVGPSTPDFIKSLGKDADYVYDGSQWTPQVKYKSQFYLSVSDYVAAYKAKYPGEGDPDYHVAESTAACLALQRAIEKANSLDPKKVRDALAALDVTTFYGQIKFDSRGINTFKPMVVEQIQGGEHHTVFPSDVADKKPMYPTPSWDQR